MQLASEDIQEFSQLWEREFGENISEGEAQLRASQVLELYLSIAESIIAKGKAAQI